MELPCQDNLPTLQDGGLRLRPAVLPDDIAPALPWYSDPEVMLFSEGDAGARYDAEMIGKMYDYLTGIGELYIIELELDGAWRAVGDATLAPDTLPIVIGAAQHRSRGIGARVMQLLEQRARELGWRELRTKGVRTYNERSRRLFIGAGFVQDGDVEPDEEGEPVWRFVKRL